MEAVANAWDTVDWERLQARIETETEALGVRQDDSEERRKRLVEESNSYRERTNKENRKLAVPLIKAFQLECDGLIARSQSAESALIDICSQITNLPDPKSLLKGAEAWKQDADKTKRAVEERESLKKQLQQTQLELADLRNQDVELRKLKGEIAKRETEHELLIDDTIDSVEKRLRDEFDARIDEMNLKNEKIKMENEGLEKKVNELEARHRDTQRKLDVAKATVDQKEVLESEQLEIAYKDLDSANHKVVCLEEKVAQLTAEIEKMGELRRNGGIAGVEALSGAMKEKDEQIERMYRDKEFSEKRMEEEIQKWRGKALALEKEHNRQNVMIEELRSQLEARSDYDAIKKEIRLLREIEFGESGSDSNSSEQVGETNSVESIDKLLAEKNRRLQNENASLRMMNEGYKGDDNEASRREVENGQNGKDQKEIVYEKIEDDEQEDEEEEGSSLDLLSLLRKMKDETVMKPKPKICKMATHTITTTALPAQKSFDESSEKSTISEETELKLGNLFGLATARSSDEKSSTETDIVEKMQARIQNNVKRLGVRSLNTLEIARQCKKLMVSYNIGQRLFAKHVMNQVVKSQGSLSELLSKPRHWSKLTDKGREAFRRIYGWISDDKTIDMLCSLSPRRVWPSEQKVEHPKAESLWECNSGNLPVVEDSKESSPSKPTSAREDQYRMASQGSQGSSSSSPAKVQTPPTTLLPPSTSSRLRDRSRENVLSSPTMVPVSVNRSATTTTTPIRSSRWRHDDISKEKILSIFETEMAKLNEQATNITTIAGKPMSSPSAPPRRVSASVPQSEVGVVDRARMNFVDKLMKQRVSSGLLPVTQQQFDAYESLDTEQLVKQIKEFLTINSISQRQFGEFVLGLSQGSVSDLLARPKTWAQLTQKGREPFIRMQLFMDDVGVEGMQIGDEEEDDEEEEKEREKEPSMPQIQVMGEDSELAKTLASILKGQNGTNSLENGFEQMTDIIKVEPLTEIEMMMQMESSSNLEGLVKRIDVTGEEILDTYEVVHRVKLILEDNAVSCRIFGDYYLKCQPSTCADVFLRTKPYENAKPIEKQVYRKMKQFLGEGNDAIAKLIQREAMRDTPKDKIDNLFVSAAAAVTPARVLKRKSSVDSQDDDFEPKRPIQRTVISEHQKDTLRFVFINEQHPSQEICEMLAKKLDMSVRTVQNWFHNHRTRTKAREREGKVYSDALPAEGRYLKKSGNWRKELDGLLLSGKSKPSQKTSTPSSSSSEKWLSDISQPKDYVSSIISKIKSSRIPESPTMVNLVSLAGSGLNNNVNSNVNNVNNNTNNNKPKKSLAELLARSPASTAVTIKKPTSGTLDKLVAKMRQMQEAASSNGH